VTTLKVVAIVRFVRQPGPRVQRWTLWFLLILLTMAPVVLCQGVSSPGPAQASPAVTVSEECGGRHDVLCSRGTAVAVGATSRSGRDGEPELLLLAVAVAVLGTVRGLPGFPIRAPQRPLSGREQLLSVGIARI
jgi:hypothetical protein